MGDYMEMGRRTVTWAIAGQGSQAPTIQAYLVFGGLLAAGLIAGLLCAAWLRAPLRSGSYTPDERQDRFERRRASLCLAVALLLYYAAALPVVIIQSGWTELDTYLRGHLFDGFGCAALLTVAWSQLARPMPARLRPANVRMAAAKFLLPLASAAIAAAAAYVADGSWTAILTAFCAAYVFGHNFWGAVVDTAGQVEISQTTNVQGGS